MNDAVTRYLEAAFAVLVTGAAMVYPPAALIVCGLFLLGLAWINDHRTPEPEPPKVNI